MNKNSVLTAPLILLAGGLIGVTLSIVPALADNVAKEEQQLEKAATSLDQTSSEPQGAKEDAQRLETTFGVDQTRIDGLRSQNLGYGEISIALSLAQKMSGGITDANVQSIMAMRTGNPPMGWGAIAKQLGEKLGPIVSQVNDVSHESHQQAEKMDRPDKPEKVEKPERPEKPDKPQKPGKP